jgi:hypothetical protein
MTKPVNRHPNSGELALWVSADLPLASRAGIALHLWRCERCSREVKALRESRAALLDEGTATAMPPGVDWDRLSSEMTANIRLGVAAGEIVGSTPEPEPSHLWRAAVVMASVLMLAASVLWWYHRTYNPETGIARGGPLRVLTQSGGEVAPGEVILKATLGGIGVEQNGQALALAAEDESVARGVTVSLQGSMAQGSMNARYVDEDGSQVTIHRVYTE